MYIPNPSTSSKMQCKVFIFKQSIAGLNSEFSFSKINCHTKANEANLPYYLFIARRRAVLVQCEMQTASIRIWTWAIESIDYCYITSATNFSI